MPAESTNHSAAGTSCQVSTVRLRDYLAQRVDMLKLDIEGAETDVMLDVSDRLRDVHNIFVEYHSFADRPQRLDELTRRAAQTGFGSKSSRSSLPSGHSSSTPRIWEWICS